MLQDFLLNPVEYVGVKSGLEVDGGLGDSNLFLDDLSGLIVDKLDLGGQVFPRWVDVPLVDDPGKLELVPFQLGPALGVNLFLIVLLNRVLETFAGNTETIMAK